MTAPAGPSLDADGNPIPAEPDATKPFDALQEAIAGLTTTLGNQQTLTERVQVDLAERDRARVAKENAPAPAQVYSTEQLSAWVEAKQITQSQMDEQLAKQNRETQNRDTQQIVSDALTLNASNTDLKAEVAEYKRLLPHIVTDSEHPDRARLQATFKSLRSLDHPDNAKTEVAALRATFGELDSLRMVLAGAPKVPGSDGSGSGGEGEPNFTPGPGGDKGPAPEMDAREADHYKHLIGIGQYAGWEEANEIFSHKTSRRARTAA